MREWIIQQSIAAAEHLNELEEQEHRILGEHGFEEAVAEVARLESTLGIADLDSFTPG